jgi:hypothetical protein
LPAFEAVTGALVTASDVDVVKYRLEDLEAESNVVRDAYIAAHCLSYCSRYGPTLM